MRCAILLPILLVAACMRAPEPPRITPTAPQATMPPAMGDAGAGAAAAPAASSSAIHFTPPEGWTASDREVMFAEQVWDIPGGGGGTLSVVGGSVDANIQRWTSPGQFEFPGGQNDQNLVKRDLAGTKYPITLVVLKGTLVATKLIGGGPPREGWTMVGAAVTGTPLGDRAIYFKAAGPSAEMEAQLPAIEDALRALEVH